MKIQAILQEAELNEAIMNHVTTAGYPVSGMDIQINLIKGRGANGTHAVVDFVPPGSLPTNVRSDASVAEQTLSEPEVEDEPPFDLETAEEPVAEVEEEPSPKQSLFG